MPLHSYLFSHFFCNISLNPALSETQAIKVSFFMPIKTSTSEIVASLLKNYSETKQSGVTGKSNFLNSKIPSKCLM